MTPRARQSQQPPRHCAAGTTPLTAVPGFRMRPKRSRVAAWEAAMTIPAGLPEADGPNIARVYDYLLGGSHNFDADVLSQLSRSCLT
jgi:hypothetical protein